VNVASLGGLAGAFGYTAYCASKHAVVGLTDSLRCELKPQGVRVHVVCPGEFDSPMVDELDRYRSAENRAHVGTLPKASLDTIVEGTLSGLRAGRYAIFPGAAARAAALGIRLMPAVFRASGDRAIRKVYRGPSG
jgi:3-dehydrosphinganine reductase